MKHLLTILLALSCSAFAQIGGGGPPVSNTDGTITANAGTGVIGVNLGSNNAWTGYVEWKNNVTIDSGYYLFLGQAQNEVALTEQGGNGYLNILVSQGVSMANFAGSAYMPLTCGSISLGNRSSDFLGWNTLSCIGCPSDGNITLYNNAKGKTKKKD